jgi:hypothetical protein
MAELDVKDCICRLTEAVEARVSLVERESRHVWANMLTTEQAHNIFRSEVMRVNAWTRIAVAVVAALALIGNGLSMVIGNHYTLKAEACCAKVTDEKLGKFEEHQRELNKLLAREGAQSFWQELNLKGFIVQGGK